MNMAIESKDFTAENPSTGEVIWRGRSASSADIDVACRAAGRGFEMWRNHRHEDRVTVLRSFESVLKTARHELTSVIARSTGKPMWESTTEVDSMIGKIGISIEAFEKRIIDSMRDLPGGVIGETRFRPHGICAVLGPFNFPGHLPNGHIVPALLAGNVVVYKPSELTPVVGDVYARLWREAGGPDHVLQIVHGGAETGSALVTHQSINAVFFTGSYRGGCSISKSLIDRPGVIQALEMGGNNPLIVDRISDVRGAALATIQSAFISAGQRCSCARRLILVGEQAGFISEMLRLTDAIRIGLPDANPAPFIGPVISIRAAEQLCSAWNMLVSQGGRVLRELKSVPPRMNFLSPGLIDVTGLKIDDEEMFGPILQIIRVDSMDQAIEEANDTRFGLSAGLLSDDTKSWELFSRQVRAGVISWNRPTTGASSALPFGGTGDSGNGRPSAYFATDYCSHPIAIMRSDQVTMPATLPPGLS